MVKKQLVQMNIVVMLGIDINFDLQRSFQPNPYVLYWCLFEKLVLPAGNFFYRGWKPSDKNVYGRFRNDQYRVRPFSTIKSGFDIDWRF